MAILIIVLMVGGWLIWKKTSPNRKLLDAKARLRDAKVMVEVEEVNKKVDEVIAKQINEETK